MLKLVLVIIGGFVIVLILLGGLAFLMAYLNQIQRRRRNRERARIRKYHREMQKKAREIRKQKLRGTYEPLPDVKLNIPFGRVLERLINR